MRIREKNHSTLKERSIQRIDETYGIMEKDTSEGITEVI